MVVVVLVVIIVAIIARMTLALTAEILPFRLRQFAQGSLLGCLACRFVPLDFEKVEDTDLGAGKRWVRVRPPGSTGAGILFARAVGEQQMASVGNQTGGRVFIFLETDDFWRDYNRLVERGVTFVRPPAEESYGTVAVFQDLYGNLFDLIEPSGRP